MCPHDFENVLLNMLLNRTSVCKSELSPIIVILKKQLGRLSRNARLNPVCKSQPNACLSTSTQLASCTLENVSWCGCVQGILGSLLSNVLRSVGEAPITIAQTFFLSTFEDSSSNPVLTFFVGGSDISKTDCFDF